MFCFLEPKFQIMQDEFMNKNYKHFEDTEENKLIYTTIHKEYVRSPSNNRNQNILRL
jgi:ADP-ribosylation factor 2-binding protein